MQLSTSGVLYLERLNQNIRTLKFDSVKSYKPLPCVACVIEVPEWLISVPISSADESTEETPSELSLSNSEKKFLVLSHHQETPLL